MAPQHVLAKGKVKQRPVTRSPVPLPHCCPTQHLSQQGPQVGRQLYPNTGQKIFKRGHRCHNPGAPSPGHTLLTLRRAGVWTSVPVRGQWDERRRNRDTPVSPTICPSWHYRQDMGGLTKEISPSEQPAVRLETLLSGDPQRAGSV